MSRFSAEEETCLPVGRFEHFVYVKRINEIGV